MCDPPRIIPRFPEPPPLCVGILTGAVFVGILTLTLTLCYHVGVWVCRALEVSP